MGDTANIEFVFEPHVVQTARDFMDTHDEYEVAFDARAIGKTTIEDKKAVVDHHAGDRDTQDAACLQLLKLIRDHKFYDTFSKNGAPYMKGYFNSCDEDADATVFVAKYPDKAMQPKMRGLIVLESMIDRGNGIVSANPKVCGLLGRLAWINRHYTDFKYSGGIERGDATEYEEIANRTVQSYIDTAEGRGDSLPIDKSFVELERHDGFSVVRSIGAYARWGMMEKGIKAYVEFTERTDGRRQVAIGTLTQRCEFPLDVIYTLNNLGDSKVVNDGNYWGGSIRGGGSPLQTGTDLTHDQVIRNIEIALKFSSDRYSQSESLLVS